MVDSIDTSMIVFLCVAGLLLAAAAGWVLGRRGRPAPAPPRDTLYQVAWLLDSDGLLSATAPARRLCDLSDTADAWGQFHDRFSHRFRGVPHRAEMVEDAGRLLMSAIDPDDPTRLCAEWVDGIARITLEDEGDHANSGPSASMDRTGRRITQLESDLSAMQHALHAAPYPIWRIDREGQVTWFNAAFDDLHNRIIGEPVPQNLMLFTGTFDNRPNGSTTRVSASAKGSDAFHWFDITPVAVGSDRMFYGQNVDAVVNAEMAQRNFVQTLAKTFAQLSAGLAIFDRQQQLVLFNPALIDLTSLGADFLSGRPDLLSFFDRLRDSQIMPEPKNYAAWREQIGDLVAAANDGEYQEVWTLPGGLTYRLSGRPHPDGALAFLFEDISAEITLTRRFRSELELGQAVLDIAAPAFCVFDGAGAIILCNDSYRALWEHDPESTVVEMTVVDATRAWHDLCEPTPVWGDLRDFVLRKDQRAAWEDRVMPLRGGALRVQVIPIGGGATLVRFDEETLPALPETPRRKGLRTTDVDDMQKAG